MPTPKLSLARRLVGLALLGVLALSSSPAAERGRFYLIGRHKDNNPYAGCTPSASGTRVPSASSITDDLCAVWSDGAGTSPNKSVLRNGAAVSPGATGATILWLNHQIYLQANDLNWYTWTVANGYTFYSASDPEGGGVTPTGYFVAATGGSDARSCATASNSATPLATVNKGLTCLVAGDTLWLRGGTYAEMVHSGNVTVPSGTSWSSKIRIAAYPGETPILAPNGTAFVVYLGSSYSPKYIEWDGIKFDGSNVQSYTFKIEAGISGGVVYDAHHIRIQNCELVGPTSPLAGNGSNLIIYNGVGNETGASDNEILNNTIHGGGHANANQDHGIYFATSRNVIDGNTVYAAAGFGIQLWNDNANLGLISSNPTDNIIRNNIVRDSIVGSGGGGGIVLGTDTRTLVYNNRVYRIVKGGFNAGILIYNSRGGALVFNNLVYGGAGYGIWVDASSPTPTLRNNISYLNPNGDYVNNGPSTTAGTNLCGSGCNINGIPSFVSTATSDFHLNVGSLGVNTGATLSTYFTTDTAGTPRPQGSAWDIGPYER